MPMMSLNLGVGSVMIDSGTIVLLQPKVAIIHANLQRQRESGGKNEIF